MRLAWLLVLVLVGFSADQVKAQGNDLSTPRPELAFPGLKAGDRWCLCAGRWTEALQAGMAPQVVLEATHEEMLAVAPLGVLKDYAAT